MNELGLIDHAHLPSIPNARLPVTYENAKRALTECSKMDECQDWADKMEAMASYARQSEDDTLRKMCDRIQARAIRRCGELYAQIVPGKPGPKSELDEADHTQLGRVQAARDAGLSDHQRVTAQRVASIPSMEFEEAVESDNPPTITELAERGRNKKTPPIDTSYLKGRNPADFECATRLLGLVSDILKRSITINIHAAKRGLDEHERARLIGEINGCLVWLAAMLEEIDHAL